MRHSLGFGVMYPLGGPTQPPLTPIPPVARRGRLMIVVIPQLVVVTGLLWSWLGSGRHGPVPLWVFVLPVAGVLVSNALIAWRARHLRARVARAGGRLCTKCGYDLGGLSEQGTCPECGQRFRLDDTIHAWAAWGFLHCPNPLAPPGAGP